MHPFILSILAAGILLQGSGLAETTQDVHGSAHSPLTLALGAPFRDHAILQRHVALPVWGWSRPGTRVTVAFHQQHKTATAGPDGKWMVRLEPLEASSQPAEMRVTEDGGKPLIVKDIVVGEVWVATGQSNMEEPVRNTDVGKTLLKGIEQRIAAGEESLPLIREARILGKETNLAFNGYQPSPYPLERVPARWNDGSDFTGNSSIAFAFAYELYRELKVPIGILNCSVGATNLESWIPPEGLIAPQSDHAKTQRSLMQALQPGTPENQTTWERYDRKMTRWIALSKQRLARNLPPEPAPATPCDLDGKRNGTGWMYNGMMHPFIPCAIKGIIWNQGYNNRYCGLRYYDGLMVMIPGWRKAWNRPDLPVHLHQWFAGKEGSDELGLSGTDEMRLSTWLAARDLPHTHMASMIDITGALHYLAKTVPGQRLARLALKHQYGRELVAEGPSFKSYQVEGNSVRVSFDQGLQVAKVNTKSGLSIPVPIKGGDQQVTLFHLADQDGVWHRATMKIEGNEVLVSSPSVSHPRGVAYGSLQGNLPGLYNTALLPVTPFIQLDHQLVTSRSRPGEGLQIAGRKPAARLDPLRAKHSNLSLLASQFRDNAVIQADQPTTFWGDAPAGSVVQIAFNGLSKQTQVPAQDRGWQITVPALPASAEPRTLKVRCEIDGQLARETQVTNIVVGDVWFVAAPPTNTPLQAAPAHPDVRILPSFTRKRTNPTPQRYRLETSGSTTSQFYSRWCTNGELPKRSTQTAFGHALGARIHAITGKPVGIVLMETKTKTVTTLKSWIGGPWLRQAPSLLPDHEALKLQYPIDETYFTASEKLLADWRRQWQHFDTTAAARILREKRHASGEDPFPFPQLAGAETASTKAAESYNMLVCTFSPANFKGILCLTPPSFIGKDQGAHFGSEFSVMANCWKDSFQSAQDPLFCYTLPAKKLAPALALPSRIQGRSHAIPASQPAQTLIEAVLSKAYP